MDAEVSTPKNSKEVERVAELSKDLPTDCLDTDTEEDESATDPNLCSREVEYDSTLSPEWMKIKNAFDDFNLTFPIDLFSKKIETFCCPGYAKNDREKLCKPVCEPNCGANSDCQAPNKCVCRKGFVQTFGSDLCVPECSEQNKPEHSTCITPYMWECDLGYAKVQKAKGENGFECRPHCVHSCSIYGKCVAPNVCECLPGYESILIGYDADNRMALKNCNLIKG
ncbi:multiple epidermal growth factor-like domains protein 10 [Drosophila navojoa]|nr:multiple epidermal growth factor-like domains protein 10 [Drosophila navojoa]